MFFGCGTLWWGAVLTLPLLASKYTCTLLPWLHSYCVLYWTHVALIPSFGSAPARLLIKLHACRFYFSQIPATLLERIFKFSCWQPLVVNAIADLAETCSPFASFITIYPQLNLSKDYFYFSAWVLSVCSCSGCRGPAVGVGAGLGAKPESCGGPAEEEHRSGYGHGWAMSTDERRTFLLTEGARVRPRAWHWLRARSTFCAGVSQSEKERMGSPPPLLLLEDSSSCWSLHILSAIGHLSNYTQQWNAKEIKMNVHFLHRGKAVFLTRRWGLYYLWICTALI